MSNPRLPRLGRRDFLLRAGALSLAFFPFAGCSAKAEGAKDPYADAVFVEGEPPLPEEGSFTFAVLPDTQFYCQDYPENFLAQTRWVVGQRERRRIEAVFHLGDITNSNSRKQWKVAQRSLQVLTDARMPWVAVPGNHDYAAGGDGSDRTTLMSEFLPVAELSKAPHWKGCYDKEPDRSENSWHHLSVGARRFLVLCLEFGPRNDVLRWANEVVAAHADREVILITHSHVYHDDHRHDHVRYGKLQGHNPHLYFGEGPDINDGEEVWQKLISKHENFILTLNGHVVGSGLGRLTTSTAKGHAVPQVLVNFQMKPNGGDGWLRLVEMRKDGTMRTFDYSPTRQQTNASPRNQFMIPWA